MTFHKAPPGVPPNRTDNRQDMYDTDDNQKNRDQFMHGDFNREISSVHLKTLTRSRVMTEPVAPTLAATAGTASISWFATG